MTVFHEQQVCVKCCVKLGKTFTETLEMLKHAFDNESIGRTQTYDWYKRFKDDRISIEDDSRSGRLSTSTDDQHVAQVRSVIRYNRGLTVREVAEESDISLVSCHNILTDKLGMHRVAAKFVPRLLTDEQKEQRVAISQELLDQANSDENLLKNIVTGDETWVYGYDVETKAHSSQWVSKTSPRPKKARQVRSNVKVMLIAFFDYEGVVYHIFVPRGQTVNKE
jgi:transposase